MLPALKIISYFLFAAIPLGIRSYQYGVLLYMTDILLFIFLAMFFWEFRGFFWGKPKPLLTFLFFSGFSALITGLSGVVLYNFFHLILLVSVSLAAAKLIRAGIISMRTVAKLFGISAITQAVIGFLQFWKQGSLGLGFFGEPVIGQSIDGVAKVVVEGAKLARAYGIFPHPNVLAAFLVIGLISLLYLWVSRPSEWKIWSSWRNLSSDLMLGLGIFSVSLGLLLTFSRSAWLVAAVITAVFIFSGIIFKINFRQSIRLLILLFAVCLALFAGFSEYIYARAQILPTEPAISQRVAYNSLGLEMIGMRPFGVGLGNQVLFADKQGLYDKRGLVQPWQKQPIHNLYLLMAAEIGIAGALAFLFFIFKILSKNIASLILADLLLLGLTDHFLWTAQAGQLMLWLTIGLVMGLNMASGEEGARS